MASSTWEPDFVGDIKVAESFDENNIPFNEFEWIPSIET